MGDRFKAFAKRYPVPGFPNGEPCLFCLSLWALVILFVLFMGVRYVQRQ